MAVTSVWAVKSRVDNVIKYVENPEKTVEKVECTPEALSARRAVGDVIDYAENSSKTERMMYVTGIHCHPRTAADDFLVVKKRWHKLDGRLAYHGYQSFLEGEGQITAEQAHEIGVKLAQEIWGDRFQVVVATHLNTGHYHNHFVVNSVSFLDGKKYVRTKADYLQMREVSDRLCRSAGLHIFEDPSASRGKTYDEWLADREGKPTVRSTIIEDIDYAIRLSRTEKQFAGVMKELGYTFKFFGESGKLLKHPGLKPPGAAHFFRFDRLGYKYEYDSIRRRIIENSAVPGTPFLMGKGDDPRCVGYRDFSSYPEDNPKSLPFIFRRYCIRIYTFASNPRKREYIPMELREDIAKLDRYIEQMDFLYKHRIDDGASLEVERQALRDRLSALLSRRESLYSAKRRAVSRHDTAAITEATAELGITSQDIREVKRKLKLCDEVLVNSSRIEKALEPHEPEVNKTQSIGERRLRR